MADQDIKQIVKDKYGKAALKVTDGGSSCCGSTSGREAHPITSNLYTESETACLPSEATAASLGCGNPTALAELKAGETVLDLGSGGGIDVLLSARRVGPAGKAYGLDMTSEMLDLARASARAAGAGNAVFLRGQIEAIPLPDRSVDVIISNCVINLSTDRPAVFAESFRVLRPGGRLGISDILADDDLTPAQRLERGGQVGCIAGAPSFAEYRGGLTRAGFTSITITTTRHVADGVHAAIIRADRP